jgi:hypothetical protein
MSTARATALVTGASAGIGRELARLFAADRFDLVLVARRKDRLEELAHELRMKNGAEVRVLPKDLADPGAPKEICDQLAGDGVKVDVVVNNAGFGLGGKVADLPLEGQIRMVQVNVVALTYLTRALLPAMIRRRFGGVLNVGSTAAFQPGPNMAVYFATKAFVLSFTEALTEELRGTGVQATCLAPGPTLTEFGSVSGTQNTWLFRRGAMDAVTVARIGYQGFRQGRTLVVPGLHNKLIPLAVRLGPRSLVRKISGLLTSDRSRPGA